MLTNYLTVALAIVIAVLITTVVLTLRDKKKLSVEMKHIAKENEKILDMKIHLRNREGELKQYEHKLNTFAESLYLDSPNSREISSRYCVSESDLNLKPSTLEKTIKQQLSKNIADYICREFTPKKTESNGRTIYILSVRAKQL